MPWLQVRLAISPEQAETYEDALLEVGAVSVTFMDAEDQPIFEPELNTTPVVAHPPAGPVRGRQPSRAVLAHLELLTGARCPSTTAK
jgi:ribosomal protein L11 methyltransferase